MRAKNGSVPRYFDKDFKNSYQKMKEKLLAANAVVEAVRQCGVHGAKHLPSGNCPQEMEGCLLCPIDKAFQAWQSALSLPAEKEGA